MHPSDEDTFLVLITEKAVTHKEIQQILGTLGLFTSTHGLEGSKQVERTQTTQSGDLRQTQSKCLITSTKPKYSQEMFKAVTG